MMSLQPLKLLTQEQLHFISKRSVCFIHFLWLSSKITKSFPCLLQFLLHYSSLPTEPVS